MSIERESSEKRFESPCWILYRWPENYWHIYHVILWINTVEIFLNFLIFHKVYCETFFTGLSAEFM